MGSCQQKQSEIDGEENRDWWAEVGWLMSKTCETHDIILSFQAVECCIITEYYEYVNTYFEKLNKYNKAKH